MKTENNITYSQYLEENFYNNYLDKKYKKTEKNSYSSFLIPSFLAIISSIVVLFEGFSNLVTQLIKNNEPIKNSLKNIFLYFLSVKENLYFMSKTLFDNNDIENLETNFISNYNRFLESYSNLNKFFFESFIKNAIDEKIIDKQ